MSVAHVVGQFGFDDLHGEADSFDDETVFVRDAEVGGALGRLGVGRLAVRPRGR